MESLLTLRQWLQTRQHDICRAVGGAVEVNKPNSSSRHAPFSVTVRWTTTVQGSTERTVRVFEVWFTPDTCYGETAHLSDAAQRLTHSHCYYRRDLIRKVLEHRGIIT
jgi:hypothetical protein